VRRGLHDRSSASRYVRTQTDARAPTSDHEGEPHGRHELEDQRGGVAEEGQGRTVGQHQQLAQEGRAVHLCRVWAGLSAGVEACHIAGATEQTGAAHGR
jgi:hypothetical protein